MRTSLLYSRFVLSIITCLMLVHPSLMAQNWAEFGGGTEMNTGSGKAPMCAIDYNGEVVVGGSFSYVGGPTFISYIAKYNGTTWSPLGAGLNNCQWVKAMAVFNNELYVAGSFQTTNTVGNVMAYNIAKWDGTNWHAVGNGLNAEVKALQVYNGELYAGGSFTYSGGLQVNNVSKWDGVSWKACGTGMNGVVFGFTEYNSKLILGGSFTTASGNPSIKYVAAWDGTSFSTVGSGGPTATVYSVKKYNTKLIAGGNFTSPGSRIASYDGLSWMPLSNGFPNTVNYMEVYNSKLYVGGNFCCQNTTTVNNVAAWNGNAWNPLGFPGYYGAANQVDHLYAAGNGKLLVIGQFTTAGGSQARGVATFDAPLSIAAFNADKTSVCTGDSVQFSDASTGYPYPTVWNWSFPGGSPSSSTVQYPKIKYSTSGSYDVSLTVDNGNGVSSKTKFSEIYVTNLVTPLVNISANKTEICIGNNVVFTATPTSGGGNPVYQWKINGNNVGANSANFESNSLNNNDVVTCEMTSSISNCVTGNPAVSNSIVMNVTYNVNASISISSSKDTICQGESVTFTASPYNEGTNPVYQWKLNGSNVGTNSLSFTSNSLSPYDNVECELSSSLPCLYSNPVISNYISVIVNQVNQASISVSADKSTICVGELVNYSTNINNGGNSPLYQWKLNGSNIAGATASGFNSNSLSDGDKISCLLTSNINCVSNPTVLSNEEEIIVKSAPINSYSIVGKNKLCSNSNGESYSIPSVSGATNYYWSFTSGSQVISGQGTNSIMVNVGTQTEDLSLVVSNVCGSAAAVNKLITIEGPLPSPGAISGTFVVCQNTQGVLFEVPQRSDFEKYIWSLPSGSTIALGDSTFRIFADIGTYSGEVRVKGINTCGFSPEETASLTVESPILIPISPSGPAELCYGQNYGISYTADYLPNINYNWVLPTGSTLISGGGTSSIIVDIVNSGNVEVEATNTCGSTGKKIKAVNVLTIPSLGNIDGSSVVCENTEDILFFVNHLDGVTNYNWSASGGVTILSGQGTNLISLKASNLNIALSVEATNQCGTGSPSYYSVTVNPLPSPPIITQSGDVLSSSAANTYSWTMLGNSVSNSQSFVVNQSGMYVLIINDNNGCSNKDSIYANVDAPVITLTSYDNVSCKGAADGSISVNVTGGVTPYSYLWSNGVTSQNVSNILYGNYSITVTGANGKSAVLSHTITEPMALILSVNAVNPSICGNSNGSIDVAGAGGTIPYLFSIDNVNFSSSGMFGNLSAGSHVVYCKDLNNCLSSLSVSVADQNTLSSSVDNVENVLCNGGADGSIHINGLGGTSPYSYSINGGALVSSGMFSGLIAGSYYFNIIDVNGCVSNNQAVVSEPPVLTMNVSKNNETCSGQNGSITIAAGGGSGSYLYSLNGGGYQPSTSFYDLSSGSYNVGITDNNGCVLQQMHAISGTPSFSVNAIVNNVSCYGGSDGSAEVFVNGGTAPFVYNWSNGFTGSLNSNLPIGSYICNVADANGCTDQVLVNILEPLALTISVNTVNPSICGNANGTVDVSGSGGSVPYLFSIDNVNYSSSGTFGNLSAGSHVVYCKDLNNCLSSLSVSVADQNTLSSSVDNVENVLCNGGADGNIHINGLGGTSPYSYSINGGQFLSSGIFSGLIAGSYNLVVTDINGCVSSNQAVVSEPTMLNMSLIGNDESCGAQDGFISITAGGGNGGYLYSLNGGGYQPSASFYGLAAGSYNVEITDNNGCVLQQMHTIAGTPTYSVSATENHVSCYGGSDGSGEVFVNGGTAPFVYNWSNGFMGALNANLANGTYTCNVVDANGCYGQVTITINEPAQLILSVNNVNAAICGNASGFVDVTATGGASPYLYSIDNVNFGNNGMFENLLAGNYVVYTKDANNCVASISTTINNISGPVLSITTINNVSCNGQGNGSIIALASDGLSPYLYSINGVAYSGNGSFNGLGAGDFDIVVKDANNCSDSKLVQLTEPAKIISTIVPNNTTCGQSNGSATISSTGGTSPYAYSWSNGSFSSSPSGLSAQPYTVITTDNNGCAKNDTVHIGNVNGPTLGSINVVDAACSALCNGSATVNVTGGVAPYSYTWNTLPIQTTKTAISLCPGNYSVVIKDANNCQLTASVEVKALGNNPVFSGIIYINSSPAIAGVVDLYGLSSSGAFTTVASTTIGAGGSYTFSNLPVGKFMVSVTPDKGAYPYSVKTYFGNTANWLSADTLTVSCNAVISADIYLISLPQMNGKGTISGTIVNVTGGKRTSEPLPGVDVSLEEDPDGILVSNTQTDIDGNYQFNNVPEGAYKIFVDIPGLGMVNTYSVTITEEDTVFSNKNFFVDSTSTINTTYTGTMVINQTSRLNTTLLAYPNPFKGNTIVEYGITDRGEVFIEIFDLLGKKVMKINEGIKSAGNYKVSLDLNNSQYENGIYLLRLVIGDEIKTIRVNLSK